MSILPLSKVPVCGTRASCLPVPLEPFHQSAFGFLVICLDFYFYFILFWYFETGSHYIAQAGLEVITLLLVFFLSAGITGIATMPGCFYNILR
jgi:hypothetical protein